MIVYLTLSICTTQSSIYKSSIFILAFPDLIYKNKIKNMAVINIKSETDLSGFYVVFKGSVQNEKPGIYGLSHLNEHIQCKNFRHLYDDFDLDGINWNAYTSDNEVVFYFTGLDKYTKKYREEYLKSLFILNVTEEEFENEKKIVLEEYKDSFNSQSENHTLNLIRKLFNYYTPIGLREDLEKITYDVFKNYFETYFKKPHLIINISKNFEFETDIEFSTDKINTSIEYGNYNPILDITNEYKGKTSIINISPVIKEDFAYLKFIVAMLGSGLQSPLYDEIREKRGLVYFVNSAMDCITPNSGLIIIASETSDKNVEVFQETLEMILSKPEKYLTEKRFNTIKHMYQIKLEKNDILRYDNVNKFIDEKEWQVESIIKSVTLEKLLEIYPKYFNFKDWYKSIDKKEFN